MFLSAHASAKKILTFGVAVFPPYTKINKDTGMCEGEGITLTKQIFEHYDYKVDVICTSAARVFRMIENDQVDLTINIKSTQALDGKVDFLEPAFSNLNLNFYFNTAHPYDLSVATIRGYDYEGYRRQFEQKGFIFVDVPSSSDAIRIFLQDRTYALLSYQGPYNYFTDQEKVANSTNVKVRSLAVVPSFYAVNRNSKQLLSIKKILNRFAEQHQVETFIDLKVQ